MIELKCLRVILIFIALFHILTGIGLMFSVPFQKFAVSFYGSRLPLDTRDIYFIRIVGSFAFVLGYLAAMAARDPLKNKIVIFGFIEFFILRNINRHLFSQELYSGFGVSPLINDFTTFFFGTLAILLTVLILRVNRKCRLNQ